MVNRIGDGEPKTVRLKPFVTSGEVVLVGEKPTTVPIQLFRLTGGGSVLRIGRTVLWFAEDGTYDGPEMKGTGLPSADVEKIAEALAACKDNRGKAPAEAYFEEGSKGWKSETAGWPKAT